MEVIRPTCPSNVLIFQSTRPLNWSISMRKNASRDHRNVCQPISTQRFSSVLKKLSSGGSNVERRRQRRVPRSVSLRVQPLNSDFKPDGESFCAVTRDISLNGLGFINDEHFSHEFVRIGIPEHTDSTVIARVCYNLSIGVDQPLFLVGVQFLS